MSGSINYGFWLERESGTFNISVDYTIPGYIDPETGESFYETSWNYTVSTGGGSGGWGWESESVGIYLGFPPGEEIADYTVNFYAQNTFSAESVSQSWHIVNAGLALENKVLLGLADSDIIIGGYGDDVLRGFGGDDYLDAGAGNDLIEGGDGQDLLDGGAGDDTLVGGAGDDDYVIDSAGDVIVEQADGGYDWVLSTVSYTVGAHVEQLVLGGSAAIDGTGNAQNDRIDGNDAANTLTGLGGDDQLNGNGGKDILLGGAGNDTLNGGWGADRLEGGIGDDFYVVDTGGDRVIELAGQGNDSVGAQGSSYTLGDNVENLYNWSGYSSFRGTGNGLANLLQGSFRTDVLSGLAGNDRLNGGDGADVLNGGLGADVLDGGTGTDTASYADATAGVAVNLLSGRGTRGEAAGDTLLSIERLIGGAHADILIGNGGANRLEGGAGNDTLSGGAGDDWLVGGAGADTLTGGAGDDGVSYADSAGAVTVNLATQTASGGDAEGDVLNSIVHAEGSAGADTLLGNHLSNSLSGGAGNDLLDGAGGNDTLRGGAGADTLIGGAGVDTLSYSGSSAGVQIDLATGTAAGGDAEGDVFSGFERIVGSSHADTLTGDAQANVLTGGEGNDTIDAGAGNDTVLGGGGDDILDGGDGIDTLSYAGSTQYVTVQMFSGTTYEAAGWPSNRDVFTNFENLRGSEVSDALYGSSGNNRIDGGGGGDFLSGWGGNDILVGGEGDDAFHITSIGGTVRVLDFLVGGGWEDRIYVDMDESFDSFGEVMAVASQVGDDTVFDFAPGVRLILENVDMTTLTTQDIVFPSWE